MKKYKAHKIKYIKFIKTLFLFNLSFEFLDMEDRIY